VIVAVAHQLISISACRNAGLCRSGRPIVVDVKAIFIRKRPGDWASTIATLNLGLWA